MKKIVLFLGIIFVFCGIYTTSVIQSISHTTADYGHIILRDSRGTIIANKWLPGWYMIPYSLTQSGRLFEAIVAIEDRRFYEHSGFDWRAKIAWIRENLQAGKVVRWGSTLTEQYIKNLFFRWKERTIKQKVDEAIWAVYTELTHSKESILRGYLDNIYFGNNTYGLSAAIDLYFDGKRIEDLTEDDMLDIITRIHTPNIDETNIREALLYREDVAKKLGWKTANSGLWESKRRETIDLFPLITERIIWAKKSYCLWDKTELEKWAYKIPSDICTSPSLDITLSISLDLQRYTTDIIQKTLSQIEQENVTGAAVYIYSPKNNKILAYVGNRWVSSIDGSIDMITRRRSVGSVLKPFIYLLALREWREIDSYILDDTRTYPTGVDGKVFVPQNYNPRPYGPIRLREALGNSLNSSTVRLSEHIWIGRIYDFFREVWLSLDHDAGYYGYGISLGTVELSLKNIVESYTYLTNTADPNIFLIEKILSDPKNRARTFGISSILNSSIDLPVKTGTSTDFRDNWAVSYHRDAIIGVWVGNTDGSSMEDVSWVSGAWPIWHQIAEYMISRWLIQNTRSPPPEWVTDTLICLDTRCLQKEQTYLKNPEDIRSRPKDNIYYESDFVGNISTEEKEKWNIQ